MVHRRGHAREVGERQRAALEPPRHRVRRRGELVRPDRLEQRRVRHHGGHVRPRPLVGAGRVEVGPERGNVDRHVRGGVHAVDVTERAHLVRVARDRGHVRPGADRVRRRRHRHQPGPRPHQLGVLPGRELAADQVDLGPADQRADPSGGLDPRPDVGVVVEPGDHDLVVGGPLPRQRLRHPVGELRRARAEHHPLGGAADQVGDRRPGLLDNGIRTVAGGEGAAQVPDPGAVRARDRVDHGDGNLRPRRAVQVCVAVSERRIEGSHGGDVEGQEPDFSLSAVVASEAPSRGLAYSSATRPAVTPKRPASPAAASRPPAMTSASGHHYAPKPLDDRTSDPST